jgi:hypothetical protein
MMRFIEGRDRDQATLFPERLDEAIDANNPARVIDDLRVGSDLESRTANHSGIRAPVLLPAMSKRQLTQILFGAP